MLLVMHFQAQVWKTGAILIRMCSDQFLLIGLVADNLIKVKGFLGNMKCIVYCVT